MAHTYFAQIENNIVTDVAVVSAKFMAANQEQYLGVWVETFINLPTKTYAGIGYTYDPITQDFSAPIYIPGPVEPL